MNDSSNHRATVITYRQVAKTLELLPRLVQQARIRRGISQWEAARQMGIKNSTLCEIETGKRSPQLWTVMKLMNWLASEDLTPSSEPRRRVVIGCRML